jgi:hypothetical protein
MSRSRIRNFMLVPVSWRSMTMFRAVWVIQAAVGWVVAPRIRTRRVACSVTARTVMVAPVSVLVSKKSVARMAWAWERRNGAQVVWSRSGAGSMPCSLRMFHMVEAATLMPRAASSPWMRL